MDVSLGGMRTPAGPLILASGSESGYSWSGCEDREFRTWVWGLAPPPFVMRTNIPDSGISVPPGVRRGTYRIPAHVHVMCMHVTVHVMLTRSPCDSIYSLHVITTMCDSIYICTLHSQATRTHQAAG